MVSTAWLRVSGHWQSRMNLGLLNESINGTPSASAMWTCPNAGGLLMMASTANGFPVTGSGAKVDSQNPSSIVAVIFRLAPTSPFVNDSQAGSRPGSCRQPVYIPGMAA